MEYSKHSVACEQQRRTRIIHQYVDHLELGLKLLHQISKLLAISEIDSKNMSLRSSELPACFCSLRPQHATVQDMYTHDEHKKCREFRSLPEIPDKHIKVYL